MTATTEIKTIKGGICAPEGFRAAGVTCGVKDPSSPKRDLALIASDHPTVAAGVFTQNKVKAAPVRLSATYLRQGAPRAFFANSGNANACTGAEGMAHARRMADSVAKEMGLRRREVLVSSTGIIGLPLPIERIEGSVPQLVASLSPTKASSDLAAEAIMTSDTKPKSHAVEVMIGGKRVRIGAIAKGAGMINPNMATMLCFVTTDARIAKEELEEATHEAVDRSFNRITIDGDMSTNDTVLVMANQQAGNRSISPGGPGSRQFRDALTKLMVKLAKKMVADGERVTKLVEVVVKGAYTDNDAEKVARAIANSSLVKCSWNGNDPNWGRIIHAVGYSGARVREEMVDIYFDGRCAAKHGLATDTPIAELQAAVSGPKTRVCVELNLGGGEFNIFTSDLSPEYVLFNREEYAITKRKG